MGIAVIAVLTALASAAVGYLLGRLLAVIVVSLVWPLIYLGLAQEWWGSGLGDGWYAPAAAFTATALVGSTFGVLMRRPR